MRTDVKRSLLLWPAAASVTITVVSWLPTQIPQQQLPLRQDFASLIPPPQVRPLIGCSELKLEAIEIRSREEHGNRAMRLPQRLAEEFALEPVIIKAPVRHQQEELAGLALQPALGRSIRFAQPETVSLPKVESRIFGLDQIRSERAGDDRGARSTQPYRPVGNSPSDWQAGSLAIGTAGNDSGFNAIPSTFNAPEGAGGQTETGQAGAHDPRQSTLAASGSVGDLDSDRFLDSPESVIPQSNRALGRRLVDAETKSRSGDPTLDERLSNDTVDPGSKVADGSAVTEQVSGELNLEEPTVSSYRDSGKRFSDNGSSAAAARLPAVITDAFPRSIRVSDRSFSSDSSLRFDPPNPMGWPVTTELNDQLEKLAETVDGVASEVLDQFVSFPMPSDRITHWTRRVKSCLDELRTLPRLGDDRAGPLIVELGMLAAEGQREAESLDDRTRQIQWLETSYALARRIAVWQLVWEVIRHGDDGGDGDDWMVGDQPRDHFVTFNNAMAEVHADLLETGDQDAWGRYLLLDDLGNATVEPDREQRVLLAQRFLSRLQWHRLNPEQRRWLERQSIVELARLVRPWAQDAVDYANLMHQIELQEADDLNVVAIELANATQTLRYADNPMANQISDTLDTYYRNANVRLAVSAEMLKRFLPVVENKKVPINTTIMGSRVRGTSQIQSDLAIRLTPSADRWQLLLNANGQVRTDSIGRQNAVAIHTIGRSDFSSDTGIEISKRGVTIDGTEVEVRGSNRLRGIHTQFDGWPLFGPLVRSIAKSRYESLAPRANQIANREMRNRLGGEIDRMLDTKIDEATDRMRQMVLGPLGRLQLDPKVTDMQTTDKRLIARFRLAGDWQMAAFTPRPRAPASSLMSVQIHQSALNNTLEQLVPRGEPITPRELFQNVMQTFGQDAQVPDDLPEDVVIQFSRTRPITFEIEDNRLWVSFRIVRISRNESFDLTQFVVRAAYKPKIEGFKASLVRDGHLRISGPRMSMRERLPARTLFNKVLASQREIPITLAGAQDQQRFDGMAISQLELRSGWLAVAFSDETSPRIALAP